MLGTNLDATIFTKFPMDHWEDNINSGSKMIGEVRKWAKFMGKAACRRDTCIKDFEMK